MYTDITLWPNQQLAPVSTIIDLSQIPVADCLSGVTCFVKTLGSLFYYNKDSTLTPDSRGVIMPLGGIGRWLFVNQSDVFVPIVAVDPPVATQATAGSLYYVTGSTLYNPIILPASFKVNDKIKIINQVTGSIFIKPYAYLTQAVIQGSSTTSASTSAGVTSETRGTALELTGVVANTTWFVQATGSISFT